MDKEPNILVYTHSSDIDGNSEFRDVITKSISGELVDAGFNVIYIENATPLSEIMDTAEWMGAFFVIDSQYSINDSLVLFDIKCYSVWDNEILISVSNENRLSLSTDQDIIDALAEIIPVIQENLYIVEQIILAAEVEREKELEQDSEPESVLVEDPEPIAVEFVKDQLQEPEADSGSGFIPSQKPFTIQTGIAPFITTGEAAGYFISGLEFIVFGGYQFTNGLICLTPGLSVVTDFFKAEGFQVSSDNILISVGPELRAGMGFNSIADIFLRLSFGGTVLMINADNSGYKTIIIPYLSMGFGADYYFHEKIGFFIISNYSLYLEQSILISGFSPTIGVNYRL